LFSFRLTPFGKCAYGSNDKGFAKTIPPAPCAEIRGGFMRFYGVYAAIRRVVAVVLSIYRVLEHKKTHAARAKIKNIFILKSKQIV